MVRGFSFFRASPIAGRISAGFQMDEVAIITSFI
jgi:hypothetical protein